jgi:cytochrome c553
LRNTNRIESLREGFMRNCIWALALAVLVAPAIMAKPPQQEKETPPPWAYGFRSAADPSPSAGPAAAATPEPDDGTLRRLTDSPFSFTLTQIRDGFGPADWYPGDHPPMPEIVAHGKKPEVRACSLCHYPNGKGRPENAGIAGLPYDYILQELAEFKNGERASADPRKPNTHFMVDFAKSMTDDEGKSAARYFASMKWTPWIKVVETETVPKTRIQNGMFLRLEGDATEPIGRRIIETPVNAETTEMLRDPRSGFIAYVPVGSIKKGEALVMKGGAGKTTQCTICHAADLQGLGPVPGLAGRSPSYLVRQLYDIQHGSRSGVWTSLMKPVVANLTTDDMLAIAAYLSSRGIPPASATTAGNSLTHQGKDFSSGNK